ncbi:hypothetical protein HGB47_16415 [Leptospira yasudae]|uniref:hypothetical protein n=1 Tax=Leptospira yasudae TaxID=2202201 RepID=UPI001C4F83BE|nr:hypothetical protein [Leptospira yasudae]MBW0435197.1 hypothetical protein [Leptospira yasudae]
MKKCICVFLGAISLNCQILSIIPIQNSGYEYLSQQEYDFQYLPMENFKNSYIRIYVLNAEYNTPNEFQKSYSIAASISESHWDYFFGSELIIFPIPYPEQKEFGYLGSKHEALWWKNTGIDFAFEEGTNVASGCNNYYPVPSGPVYFHAEIRKKRNFFGSLSKGFNINLQSNQTFDIEVNMDNKEYVATIINTPNNIRANICHKKRSRHVEGVNAL